MLIRVFLSHSTKDDQFVRDLSEFLENGGEIKTWADHHDIEPGQKFVSRIEEGLEADAVLTVLSPDAVKSQWVDREWKAALGAGISVAPVLCRACKVPNLLAGVNRFDATRNRLDVFRDIKAWLTGMKPRGPQPFHAPSRPPLFVGRERELETLRTRLGEEGAVVPVQGLPGLGKTVLALEFAHRYRGDFDGVYWLQCVGRDLGALAAELEFQLRTKVDGDLEKILHDLRAELEQKRCLLVLDNVEGDEVERLIPAGRASVLVTTRQEHLAFLGHHKNVSPEVFSEEDCLDLFRRVLGPQQVAKSEQRAKELFQQLGYLPIGISVAAGLVNYDARYTIDSLAAKLPSLEKMAFGKDNVGVLLKEAIGRTGERGRQLMAAMAVCAPEGFRLGLAAEIADFNEETALDALQELKSRSLVEELDKEARRYRLHALVRAAAEPADSLRLLHAQAMERRFENWETNWRECEKDLGDLRQASRWTIEEAADDERWRIGGQLAYAGFRLTERIGRLPEAYEFNEQVARAAEIRGDKHAVQAGFGNQALILRTWGRLEEALTLHRKEEAICEELKDRDGLQASYGNQASILRRWGRLEEAMALHKKGEAICEELGNRDDLQRSYGSQALILQAWGRLEEAMALHKKGEAICEELGNRDSLQRSYGNQALILKAWGRLDEALALHKKEEAICEELGNRDGLQASYGNQALILRRWGRLEEALALHKKEEAICEELGDRDGLQASYGNQALILKAWGRLEEALALQERKEAICEELGNRDSLQISYGNQASILRDWGRLEEALALLKRKEAICKELGKRDSLAHGYWSMAGLARKRGDIPEARKLANDALAIFSELKMPREIEGVQTLIAEIGD
jgi:tetratricopeptide (TPR) repeat protein